MKLSRNKILKLLNGNNQTLKINKKYKRSSSKGKRTFRKKRQVNLRNKSIKKIVLIGGLQSDKKNRENLKNKKNRNETKRFNKVKSKKEKKAQAKTNINADVADLTNNNQTIQLSQVVDDSNNSQFINKAIETEPLTTTDDENKSITDDMDKQKLVIDDTDKSLTLSDDVDKLKPILDNTDKPITTLDEDKPITTTDTVDEPIITLDEDNPITTTDDVNNTITTLDEDQLPPYSPSQVPLQFNEKNDVTSKTNKIVITIDVPPSLMNNISASGVNLYTAVDNIKTNMSQTIGGTKIKYNSQKKRNNRNKYKKTKKH